MRALALALVLAVFPGCASALDCSDLYTAKKEKPLKEGQNPTKALTGAELNAVNARLKELCEAQNAIQAAVAAMGGGLSPAVAPVCSSFTPTSGPVGTVVTVSGSGFATTTGVTLGSTSASYSTLSDARVTAVIPSAASGTLYIANTVSEDDCGIFTVTADPVADPVISGVVVTPDTTSVTVEWSVSPSSTGQVFLGTTTALGLNSIKDSSYLSFHRQVIGGLSAGTTYYYEIESIDAGGNSVRTAQASFTTSSAGLYPEAENPITPTATLGGQPVVAKPALLGSVTNEFGSLGTSYDTTTVYASTRRHLGYKSAVWNRDETRILLGTQGNGYLLDGASYAELSDLEATEALPGDYRTWSSVDSSYGYGMSGSLKAWMKWQANGDHSVLKSYASADFTGSPVISSLTWGNSDSALDDFDTGATLILNTNVVVLINPTTGAVICEVPERGGFNDADDTDASPLYAESATMSHSGEYFAVNWYDADANDDEGKHVYRASDCSAVGNQTIPGSGHWDFCVSSAGADVIVTETDPVKMFDVETGLGTTLFDDTVGRWHVSCRNIDRPGWAYLSHDNRTCDTSYTGAKTYHRVIALKLDGSGTVENYAWDHAVCPGSYDQEANVVPSPSGTRVWWKGGWSSGADVESYVAGKNP